MVLILCQMAVTGNLLKWNPSSKVPSLSEPFRHLRSIRMIPTDDVSLENSLQEFDNVVADIETSIINEVDGQVIQTSWKTNPDKRTYDACDYKTFWGSSTSKRSLQYPNFIKAT